MAENPETTSSTEWFDAKIAKDTPTFWGGAVFFMISLIAIFANLAFGGVSTGVIGIISILIGLLVIFWLADAWQTGHLSFSTNSLQLPILGLILLGLIQLLPFSGPDIPGDLLNTPAVSSLSLDPYSTRLAILKLIIFAVFFAASLKYIGNRTRLRKIVVTIIIFGAIMAFFGVLQKLGGSEYIYGFRPVEQANPFASYVNQHHFATFLEMTIGLTLGLLLGGGVKKDKLLLLIIAIVLMGIGILFTSSRGGLISLFGVIGFLVVLNLLYRRKNEKDTGDRDGEEGQNPLLYKIGLIGGSMVLIAVLMISVIWIGGGDLVLRGTGIQANQADFTNGRTHFWTVALQIFRDNPVIGAGLESFGVAFTKYDTWNGVYRIEQAHNDYLQILADGGILGLICVIAFIVLLFKQSLKLINQTSDSFRRNVAMGALAGCLGVMIHSFFDFPLRTNANMFFFLIMVTLAVVPINYPKLHRKRVRKRVKNKTKSI
jgi:O-antigen ligase